MNTGFFNKVYFGNTLKDIFIAFGIILLFGIISKVARYLIKNKIAKLADFTDTDFDNKLIDRLEKPLGNYVFIFGLSLAKTFITLDHSVDSVIVDTITAAAIINTGYLIFRVSDLFLSLLFTMTQKTKITLDDDIIKYLDKSVKIFIVLLTVIIVIENYVIFSKDMAKVIHKIFIMFVTINIIYILMKAVDAIIQYLKPLVEKTESKLDDQLLPIIRKIVKTCLIIIGVLSILKNLGYDVSALLAGLGIGGLAFALAAQDTIANFFGSIVVFSDQPFQIGDRIVVNGKDGSVEDVGLRSTKIKTLQGTQIIIPNKEIANSSIENISRRPARKVEADFGIVYSSTPAQIIKAVNLIKEILNNEQLVRKDYNVFFANFKDFSLNIKAIYWCEVNDFAGYTELQTAINSKIKEKFDEHKLDFAFLTQTLHIQK